MQRIRIFVMPAIVVALAALLASCGDPVLELLDSSNGNGNSTQGTSSGGTSPKNHAPVADAGADFSVSQGLSRWSLELLPEPVTLDGSGSHDPDGDSLNYVWRVVSKPEGSLAALSAPGTAYPEFVPDRDGAYVFSLRVGDGQLASATSRVKVTVTGIAQSSVWGDFAFTGQPYSAASDWDQAVADELGSGYRVADWNDISAFYDAGGDLTSFMDGFGFTWDSSAFVTYGGAKQSSSDRYYFVTRHDQHLPTSYLYLSHENLDSNMIDLGSWNIALPILAVKVTP